MDRERAMLERLDRIDALRAEDVPASVLLGEVRALLAEAEEWVREGPSAPARAVEAIERSRVALEAGERAASQALVAR